MGPRVTPPRGPKKAKRGRASERGNDIRTGPDRIAVAPAARMADHVAWASGISFHFLLCVSSLPRKQMCRYFLWSHACARSTRAVWRRRIRAGVQRVIQLSE